MAKLLAEIHQYAVIVDSEGKVLWLRSAGGKKKFMFPGGTMEEGETDRDALMREIREETNLSVDVIMPIHTELLLHKKPPLFGAVYLCKKPKGKIVLSHEHSEYKWVNPKDMKETKVGHATLIQIAQSALTLFEKLNLE